jgi:hypothetical protein
LAVYTYLERNKRVFRNRAHHFSMGYGTIYVFKDKVHAWPINVSARQPTLVKGRSFVHLPNPPPPFQLSLAYSVFSQSGSSHVLTSLDTGTSFTSALLVSCAFCVPLPNTFIYCPLLIRLFDPITSGNLIVIRRCEMVGLSEHKSIFFFFFSSLCKFVGV